MFRGDFMVVAPCWLIRVWCFVRSVIRVGVTWEFLEVQARFFASHQAANLYEPLFYLWQIRLLRSSLDLDAYFGRSESTDVVEPR